MKDRIQFQEHKGKRILRLDFTNAKSDQVIQLVRQAMPVIAEQPPKSLRTLTDVTDMKFNTEAADALKEFAKHNTPYVTAGAVVGVTGLKKIIYNAVLKFSGRNLVAFDSAEQAKDWLVSQ